MPTYTKYYVLECPLKDECSSASWDRCRKCVSWESEEHCRKLLFDHLSKSGRHQNREDDLDISEVVDYTEVMTEEVDGKWFEDNNTETKPEHKTDHRSDRDRSTRERTPKPRRRRSSPTHSQGTSSKAAAPQQLEMVPKQPVRPPPPTLLLPPDEQVTVSRTLLKHVLDSIDRAESAAVHAVQISGQARAAFEEESRKLRDTASDVRRMLDRL